MPAVYTRTGDKGATGLFGGSRVAKQSLRVEAYGTVDEANAAIGEAKSGLEPGPWRDRVHTIQQRLFVLGAELASDGAGAEILGNKIAEADVEVLERLIDDCLAITGPQRAFVVPGRDAVSAPFHSARTVVRRAERRVLTLSENEQVRPELVRYLNRLSDAVYALARLTETWFELARVEQVVREVVARMVPGAQGVVATEQTSGRWGAMRQRPSELTLAVCKRLAEVSEAKASELGVPIVFAAVDPSGNPILLHRMADSLLGSIDIAMNKAWSANAFKQSTASLGRAAATVLPGLADGNKGRVVLFGGGEPVFVDGRLLGGLGISGGTVEEDCQILNFAMEQVLGDM